MSFNQREFFDGKIKNWTSLRAENHSWAGIFLLVLGLMIVFEAIALELMRRNRTGLDDKQFGKAMIKASGSSDRNIVKKEGNGHEQCEFNYIKDWRAKQQSYRNDALNEIHTRKKKDPKEKMAAEDKYDEYELTDEDLDYDIIQDEDGNKF
jgi:hypothetical protein